MRNWLFWMALFLCSETFGTSEPFYPGSPSHLPYNDTHFYSRESRVNVVTGEYCEQECDLQVAGIEPLSYRRFYNNLGFRDEAYGHWRINPETHFLLSYYDCEYQGTQHERYAAVGSAQGGSLMLKGGEGGVFFIKPDAAFSTTVGEWGRTHPLNLHVRLTKTAGYGYGRNPDIYHGLKGTISAGDGSQRHLFLERIPIPHNRKINAQSHPPYQGRLTEQRLPNGNILKYEYVEHTIGNLFEDDPTYFLLSSVKAYSAKGAFLGELAINYNKHHGGRRGKRVEQISVTGSDQRCVLLDQTIRKITEKGLYPKYDTILNFAERPGKPTLFYGYQHGDYANYFKNPYLCETSTGEGRCLRTHYDPLSGKVLSQTAPVGRNGAYHPIFRYEYGSSQTHAYDAEGKHTLYRYDAKHRITSVSDFVGDKIYRTEKRKWNDQGDLLSTRLLGPKHRPICYTEYEYDDNHNPIAITTSDGTTHDRISRIYSDDGRNLLLEETIGDTTTSYTYVAGTNLIETQCTSDNEKLLKRTFHFYDSEICTAPIRIIVDDGSSTDPNDLQDVTYRMTTEFTLKRAGRCIGLPIEMRTKTLNDAQEEILLSRVRYTYHRSGQIEKEEHYDATNTHRYTLFKYYDEKERLITETDPLGHETYYTYDTHFNLKSKQGPHPDSHIVWEYDKANRPIREHHCQSDETHLTLHREFDKASRLTKEIDPFDNATSYVYDTLGRIIEKHLPNGGIETYEYDSQDNVTLFRDPKGYETKATYNFRNQPTGVMYPDKRQDSYTYFPHTGALESHTNTQGTKTLYRRDPFGRPTHIQVFGPEENLLKETFATYSPFQKLSETDASGITTFYRYDYAGRLIAEEREERLITYAYDTLGRLCRTTAGDSVTIQTYDLADRLIQKRIENSQGKNLSWEKYSYDEAGNLTQTIDCLGTSTRKYDAEARLLLEIDPLGNKTKIEHRFSDHYTKITTSPDQTRIEEHYNSLDKVEILSTYSPEGELIQSRQHSYDLCGNLTDLKETLFLAANPSGMIHHTWEYGPSNRLEKLSEAQTRITIYGYDYCGRQNLILKPNGTSIHSEYDALGRLSRYYAPSIDYRYTYDHADRITDVHDTINDQWTKRIYDKYGNLIEERLANNLVLASTYNPYNQRLEFNLPNYTTARYTYDGPYLKTIDWKDLLYTYSKRNQAGLITQSTLPNNLGTLDISWDPAKRRRDFSAPHYNASYRYDRVGNIIQVDTIDPLGSDCHDYCHDPLHQLIEDNTQTYTYDSLYNRHSKDSENYMIDPLSQITAIDNTPCTYDPNGNLLSDGKAHYTYDALDRLISVTNGTTTTLFTYDPFHRRMSKDSTTYIWDGNQEVGSYWWGFLQDLRILGEGFGAEIGAAVFHKIGGYIYLPIHDHQGSLIISLDVRDGAPQETYRYTPFGEQRTTSADTPWRFASKRYDPETELIYFGRRYYKPAWGRWITPDPLGYADGPNRYAYAQNSPLLLSDPHGLYVNPFYPLFRGLECYGRHIYIIPGIKNVMESVGRWGCGRGFQLPEERRNDQNCIQHIEGQKIDNIMVTLHPGVLATPRSSFESAKQVSEYYGGTEVTFFHESSKGLVHDALSGGLGKLGFISSFDRQTAEFYRTQFDQNPDLRAHCIAHSRGGTRMMNVKRLLSDEHCQRITIDTYGSASLVPREAFGRAQNYVNPYDPVTPFTNPITYLQGLTGRGIDMQFSRSSENLFPKSHYLFPGYEEEINDEGKLFIKQYLK